MRLMSQAEFAKHCKVSRAAVTQWKLAGKLVMRGDKVCVDESIARMEMLRRGGAPVKDDVNAGLEMAATGSSASYDELRRAKEFYVVALNRLEYEEKSGRLIDKEKAKNVLFSESRRARDMWMNWPVKAAPLIAAKLGLDEIDRFTEALTDAVYKHLEEIGSQDGDWER